jgi:hypothetical protein
MLVNKISINEFKYKIDISDLKKVGDFRSDIIIQEKESGYIRHISGRKNYIDIPPVCKSDRLVMIIYQRKDRE